MRNYIAIIVTGDRHGNEMRWWNTIHTVLEGVAGSQRTLIHGDCAGIDRMCHDVAREDGRWSILPMPYIDRLGKSGGPARNREMANVGKALQRVGYEVVCLAFHDDLEHSKGTKNMVAEAKKAGIPVSLCTSDGIVKEI